MAHLKLSSLIFLFAFILFNCSCNHSGNSSKKNNAEQTSVNDSASTMASSTAQQNSQASDTTVKNGDTSASAPNNNSDSMLSQIKNLASMFGKNDSGILKNPGGENGMNSMMQKMQSMMGGKAGSPGDAVGKQILNLQLGQMKDDNPLKEVAKGMQQAQENGTAGPSKTYTAVYTPEQPDNFSVPISGNGYTIMLQYTGGSISNGKKDGLWKNIYINTNKANKWNVYSEGYAELSALNMKVHSTLLSGIHENYNIILNEQYKKYSMQQRSDLGKNESDVHVQKIGNEKLFGYNCVHVKISYTLKALGQTAQMQDDEWYSVDAPGSQFLSPKIFESHSPDIVKEIINAGCSGVLIKSIIKSSGSSQVIQFSSITKKDMPGSTFNLPANYTEDKNTALFDIQ